MFQEMLGRYKTPDSNIVLNEDLFTSTGKIVTEEMQEKQVAHAAAS